jgi:DNA-binding LacI/PurR family transcriptional regulator
LARATPTSIKDIARLANVSHSTVSRALRNSPLINRETTERIQRIALESGYRASAVARGLVTKKTRAIGVVVTTMSDPFVGDVVSGIQESADLNGYSILLAESNTDPDRERSAVQSFAERRVDGIVVTSSRVGALYLPLLAELGVPVMLINNQHPGPFVHSVMIENVEGSRAATAHLIELGHRRIAYIGDEFGRQSDAERLEGYRQALKAAGIRRELVVAGDGRPERAMRAMTALLERSQPPTAVFCYNDLTAVGALRAIHAAGLHVPRDVSVVGFDDVLIGAWTEPPLTTVRQPRRRMGSLAVEGLLRLMDGNAAEQNVKVPAELIVRESTAPPRKESR